MTPLQKRLIEMLKLFHVYCVKYNFRYYIIGGTLLGAVRHQGFIPWDDDIDVGMPRADYEAFLKQVDLDKEEVLPFLIESQYTQSASFPYLFTKCYDTRTTLIENLDPPVKRGIFIDIFPLDGIGNSVSEAHTNYKKIQRHRTTLKRAIRKIPQNIDFYKKYFLIIIKKLHNRKKLIHKIDTLCKKCDFNNSLYVGNLVGAWGHKEIVLRSTFGEPTKYIFEGHDFYGPEDYHSYLTTIYGDYMTPPPKEKRIPQHSSFCDLNKSYLDEDTELND